MILKYRWTIVAFLLPIALAAAIALWWTAPLYTATATLHIENRLSNIVGAPEAFPSRAHREQPRPILPNAAQSAQKPQSRGSGHPGFTTRLPTRALSRLRKISSPGFKNMSVGG